MSVKTLYLDEKIALYFDEDRAIFIEYDRNSEDGLGKKSYIAPDWYIRLEKINALLPPQPATDDDTKVL